MAPVSRVRRARESAASVAVSLASVEAVTVRGAARAVATPVADPRGLVAGSENPVPLERRGSAVQHRLAALAARHNRFCFLFRRAEAFFIAKVREKHAFCFFLRGGRRVSR